jgi:hypothetical protein
MIINVVAVLYGAVMIVNFGLWHTDALGDWGNGLRDLSNPTINTLTFLGSAPLTSLPAWPIFETTVVLVVIVGVLYYLGAERGRVDQAAVAIDPATGEAVIG